VKVEYGNIAVMKEYNNQLLNTIIAQKRAELGQNMTDEEKKLESEIEQLISSKLSEEDKQRFFMNCTLGLNPPYVIEDGKIVVPKYNIQ
jgi:hypothetical protein